MTVKQGERVKDTGGRGAIALAVLAAALGGSASAADRPVVFQDVRVFDGQRVIPRATVLVKDDAIQAVGERIAAPEAAEVIDGRGCTLLPGLIDAHVHVIRPESLRQALVFGVTTELDMGMSHELAAQIKRQHKLGQGRDMADLRTAGTLATSPGGHGTEYGLKIPTISRPEAAQEFVDARIGEGSDYVKIIYADGRPQGVAKTVLRALVEAAHKRKRLAVVHIMTLAGARDAVEAGADGLAHAFADREPDEQFGRFVAERGAFVVPTLTVLQSCCGIASGQSLAEDERLGPYLSELSRVALKRSFRTKWSYAAAEQAVCLLRAARVPILAGTDAPNPGTAHGASIHREMELLVKAGLKQAEALAAATSVPARAFDLTDRGRIARGLRADLLLVKGDPTAEIKATRQIVGVWKQGRRVDRQGYRERLAKRRAAAEAPPPQGSASGWVSDFEDGQASARFGVGWQVSTDRIMGGNSTAKIRVVEGGAEGSKRSLLVTGQVAEGTVVWAGAMFWPGRWPTAPANLLSKKQITFWAKGDGQTCIVALYAQSRGYIPAVKTFAAGPKWKQFTFGIRDFEGLDGHDLTGVLFGRSPEPGKFRLQIDNVRFLPAEAQGPTKSP